MIFKIDGYGGNDQRQCAFNLMWLTLAASRSATWARIHAAHSVLQPLAGQAS